MKAKLLFLVFLTSNLSASQAEIQLALKITLNNNTNEKVHFKMATSSDQFIEDGKKTSFIIKNDGTLNAGEHKIVKIRALYANTTMPMTYHLSYLFCSLDQKFDQKSATRYKQDASGGIYNIDKNGDGALTITKTK